jgi:hypothetical protein
LYGLQRFFNVPAVSQPNYVERLFCRGSVDRHFCQLPQYYVQHCSAAALEETEHFACELAEMPMTSNERQQGIGSRWFVDAVSITRFYVGAYN